MKTPEQLQIENTELRELLLRHIYHYVRSGELICVECGNVRRFGHTEDCVFVELGLAEKGEE